MKLFRREKKPNLPQTELDEYTTRIFHFVYNQKRIPTNQEMFLELEIPSNHLEEVIHYFNHPPKAKPLKKYTKEEIKQLDAQSVLLTPFVQEEQINLTEVVINLNYQLSTARELVDFCNQIIELPTKKLKDYFDIFKHVEIDLNVVRVIQTHHSLRGIDSPKPISVLKLAQASKLGVLSTRLAMNHYEDERRNIPTTTDLTEEHVRRLDKEIRKSFPDLLQAPSISLEKILTHQNWKLPIPDPPELTIENVTKMTDRFVRENKSKGRDPITGIFQFAGEALNSLVNTYITPAFQKVFTDSFPDPTFSHAKEILAVLQPIRDQTIELSAAFQVGFQTIQYVPAEQVKILKEKDRIFCSACHSFYPKKNPHFQCTKCQRIVCPDCEQVGVTKCPICRGKILSVG
ncbi:MAG: hypothetical protein ACXAC8_19405 [Candidatus Hodarchaeales archaeon]